MKHIILFTVLVLFGCGSRDEQNDGLGAGLGWTTEEVAAKLAIGFVQAHGLIDWKLDKVEKTKDGWNVIFISPEIVIDKTDLRDSANKHLYPNRHFIFVQCDGWLVHGQIVG